jgi:hypothetical protein
MADKYWRTLLALVPTFAESAASSDDPLLSQVAGYKVSDAKQKA